MSKRAVLAGIGAGLVTVALLAGVGRAAYEAGRDDRVVITNDGGEPTTADRVVVVDRDRHGPGPGFVLVPLVVIGGFGLLMATRHRGHHHHHGHGGWGPGGAPWASREQFLEDWHSRAHQHDAPPAAT